VSAVKRALILLLAVVVISAFAVNYPRKPVTIICPWGAGGGTDRLARFLADELSKKLGQPFTVVNRTGGGGAVGHAAGAYAAPDGYTLTLVTLEIATMHWMGLTDLTFEAFDYIAQVNEDPAGVIVKVDAPWKTLQDLLNDIKANPGKYLFSGTAAAGIWDLARIGMLDAAGISPDAVTWVPTTGAAQGLVELLGGHVHVVTCSIAEAVSQIQSGQARALAVMADERHPMFPDVPTLKELGINWSAGTWRGVAVPKGTPSEIRKILEDAIIEIANSESFKNFMQTNGFGIKIRRGQEFYEFIKQQDQAWKRVLELGGYLQK
jgi:tripartite-type tricarboxylate transporter receptor subunit TctC